MFFYGLFMDQSLLAARGIIPSTAAIGYVEGYGLRIGRRATLVPEEGNRAYGLLMTMRLQELGALCSDDDVEDHVCESVTVVLSDRTCEAALYYILPERELEGTNSQYAHAVLSLAENLGLPDDYLSRIRSHIG